MALESAAMANLVPQASRARALATGTLGAGIVACLLGWSTGVAAAAVYRWVDAQGITHLSSVKPPAGVKYERLSVGGGSTSGRSASQGARPTTATSVGQRLAVVSPEQQARRDDAIGELQNRECVVALEAIDRVGRSGSPVDPVEFKRLQQTADQNCSKDPATRRRQEEMAARLRVSRSDACVQARNALAEMLEPGRRPTRERLKTQQEFIEDHCEAPVR